MTDLIMKERSGGGLEFWDPYDDLEPIHVMMSEDFPEDYYELCDLLEQLGTDVQYLPDPL